VGFYTNKKILITGATGTIGQHLVRQILKDEPAVIRIFSRDEHKQFEMQQALHEYSRSLRFLIGDVRDLNRLTRAMKDIDYVFHLAAMKHVPACEYNPFEAVQTNVIGTQNVIQAAMENDVTKVLFTSTDKAVTPTNTYGATKLTAERLISAAEFQKGPRSTQFTAVRFGNVMGSRGSVIPLLKGQIIERKTVTVTNMNMTRYMMTPHQAISLLLTANEQTLGGEVFVLKMPIVRLSDLVEVMIEEISEKYKISGSIGIEEIGLRPGEKMDEQLMTPDEQDKMFELDYMYIIPPLYSSSNEHYRPIRTTVFEKNPFAPNIMIEKEVLRSWLINERLI